MDSLPVGLPGSSASSSRAVSLREMMRRAAVARPLVDFGPVGDIGAVSSSGWSNAVPLEEGNSIPTLNWLPQPLALTESSSFHDDEDGAGATNVCSVVTGASLVTTTAAISDPVERRTNALAALEAIAECPALHPHLPSLLSGRDTQGHTPLSSLSASPDALLMTLLYTLSVATTRVPLLGLVPST